MTNEELVKLLKRSPDNEDLLTQLYQQVEKLIFMKASRYQKRTKESFEDVLSVLHIAFMKAVKGFDESRNVKFVTYLDLIIRQQMSTQIFCKEHALKRKATVLSFTQELPNQDSVLVEDAIGEFDDLSSLNVLHLINLTRDYLTSCSSRAADVIKLHLTIEGIYQREIAQKLDISEHSVSNYISRYRNFMRKQEKAHLNGRQTKVGV